MLDVLPSLYMSLFPSSNQHLFSLQSSDKEKKYKNNSFLIIPG